MHLLFALMFGLSLRFEPEVAQASLAEPIQAVFIDQAAIEREKEHKAEQHKQREEEARRQAEKKKAEQLEAKRQADLKKRQEAEKERKIEEKKQRLAEEKRKVEAQRKIDEKRKAEEKKQRQAEAARQAEEKKQREAETKRKAEEKRKKEAEAKRKAEEKKQREAKEAKRQLISSCTSAFRAKEPEIRNKVRKGWVNPSEMTSLVVTISVKVTRDGEVTSANMVRGSGDAIYDRSTEVAVLKASPLPFPDDPRCYEFLKEFNFEFYPEG